MSVISFEITDPNGDDIDVASIRIFVDGQAVMPISDAQNPKRVRVQHALNRATSTIAERVNVRLQASDSRAPAGQTTEDYYFVIGNNEAEVALCPTPTGLSATSLEGNLVLSWTAPQSAAVSGYTLYSGTSSDQLTRMDRLGNLERVTLSGYTPGQTYYLALTSTGICSESDYSNLVSITLPAGGIGRSTTASARPASTNPRIQPGFHPAAQSSQTAIPAKLPTTGAPWLWLLVPLIGIGAYQLHRRLVRR